MYFRMNGFSRIREEKKKVIWRRKKQLDQRGLPVYFQMVPVLDFKRGSIINIKCKIRTDAVKEGLA